MFSKKTAYHHKATKITKKDFINKAVYFVSFVSSWWIRTFYGFIILVQQKKPRLPIKYL